MQIRLRGRLCKASDPKNTISQIQNQHVNWIHARHTDVLLVCFGMFQLRILQAKVASQSSGSSPVAFSKRLYISTYSGGWVKMDRWKRLFHIRMTQIYSNLYFWKINLLVYSCNRLKSQPHLVTWVLLTKAVVKCITKAELAIRI